MEEKATGPRNSREEVPWEEIWGGQSPVVVYCSTRLQKGVKVNQVLLSTVGFVSFKYWREPWLVMALETSWPYTVSEHGAVCLSFVDNILVSVRAVFLESVVPLLDLGYSGAMAAVCEAVCSLTYDLHGNSHVACDSPDPGSC